MIDVHTHLEQKDYDNDREEEISKIKEKLKAVVSCATHPKDFQKGLDMAEKHPNFVFLSAGMHPMYVKEISPKERDAFLYLLEENRKMIVSIGESGLDYSWVKDKEGQEDQREFFRQMIDFARSLKKPLTIHSREAQEDTVRILEDEGYHKVHWHLFKYRSIVPNVIKNGWKVSIGPILNSSKSMPKIVQDLPLENIMLETDSPWWGGKGRGTSLNIIPVAKKIAEVKGLGFDYVWKKCGENATEFFNLDLE